MDDVVLSVVTPATVGSEASPSWVSALEQAPPTTAPMAQITIARRYRRGDKKRATPLFNHSALRRLFLSLFPKLVLAQKL